MTQLPSPVRAALGLAATVVDEARHLPDRAIDMPMRAVSWSLQLTLRAQQHYAALAARGDEILAARETTDEPPPWATFDDDLDDDAEADGDDDGEADAGASRAKPVNAPRRGAPSAFDAVSEEAFDASIEEALDAIPDEADDKPAD